MQSPFPSPVSIWQFDTYATVSPKRAELSSADRIVIITGAGIGIGRETALAFAAQGAKRLVLNGPTDSTLAETQDCIRSSNNNVISLLFCGDTTDSKAMHHITAKVGAWDTCILNAGHITSPAPIASANLSDYWKTYETNVKSVIIAANAFLPNANKTHATMLGIIIGTLVFPPASTPGLFAYLYFEDGSGKDTGNPGC